VIGQSVDRYIELLSRQPPLLSLHHPSPEIREFLRNVGDRASFHKEAMLELIRRFRKTERMTDEVAKLYEADFSRIKREMATNPAGFYELPKDAFVKDLSLCCLRAFPARAQIVETSGIGRRIVLYGGLGHFPGAAAFLVKAGGFAPWYQIHTHTSVMADFNESGWEHCYRVIAGMLSVNPTVKGMFGISWFYDPALEAISPRLGYLRHTPLKGGARLLYRGGDHDANVKNATTKSDTRRKLYEAGKYSPVAYAMLWRRTELLRWAGI